MKKPILILVILSCSFMPFFAQTVSDFDNNTYNTITIGSQIWMKENLRSVHYSDGTAIPEAWSYTESDSLAAIYGRLYSWNSAMRGAASSTAVPSGVQGACPAGWHLPSPNEWAVLISMFGGDFEAGASLKDTGTAHWNSPNTGATNSSGFSAYAGGSRGDPGGDFSLMGSTGFWWSTEKNSGNFVTEILMGSESTGAIQLGSYMGEGYSFEDISVRCLKNSNGTGIDKELEKEIIGLNILQGGSMISILHEKIPKLEILVVSVEGKIMLQTSLNASENQLDISSLPSGIYIVKAFGTGASGFMKFVKN